MKLTFYSLVEEDFKKNMQKIRANNFLKLSKDYNKPIVGKNHAQDNIHCHC